MKYLIPLAIVWALAIAGCAKTAPLATVKSSTSNAQFKPSDHMPPEAIQAKKTAGY